MKIVLLAIGKTTESWLSSGIAVYDQRLQRYGNFEYIETEDVKRKGARQDPRLLCEAEAEKVLKLLQPGDHLVLLDEGGREYTSIGLAQWIEKRAVSGLKRLVLVIGGPYGFEEQLKNRAHEKLSLSRLTFSHQMVRLFAIEQIYRAHTILKGEPYHHE